MTKTGLLLAAAALLFAAGCGGDDDDDDDTAAGATTAPTGEPETGGTLDQIMARGTLNCGVNDAVPGFGSVTPDGDFVGFDIDYCKALAAAVLGDADAVEYRPLTAEQRFTALQTGEIDVLIRNTTWTASRDGAEGAAFLTTTFYDGQGIMVRADSPFQALEDLDGTTICVLSGTTTELNLASVFAARAIANEPLTFESNDLIEEAFTAERCDAWTSDKSQLAGVRSAWSDENGGPDALRILEETFSKEPLGPVVRDGDSQWAQVVDWVVIATIQAEEFGVTSANVAQMVTSDDPEVRRLLGGEDFDSGLGLPADFAVGVIEAVGNYGEIYDRNVGPNTPLGLDRGVNALWTDGGLHYAPPYR